MKSLDPEIETAIVNIERRKKEIRKEFGDTELDTGPVATVDSGEHSAELIDELNQVEPAWRDGYATPEEAAKVLLTDEIRFDLYDGDMRP